MRAKHVRIAGGGLSGLATATLLARDGFEVEVFDRKLGGGGRFAGGWQVIENGTQELDALDELRALGYEVDFPAVPATRATFLDGLGGRWEIRSEKPYAYFVRRGATEGSLDDWLRRHARTVGVALREGAGAPADAEVVATGPRQADGVAREVVFRSDLADTIAVLFDPAVTPSGYAYLFCLGGHATFGVAQVRHVHALDKAQVAAWERFRAQFGSFSVDLIHEGGQYMNFFLPRALSDNAGRWHVGEAAGVQDFLYGLGNRLALRSAAVVAGAMAGKSDGRALQTELLRPMRTTIALRWFYERLGRRGFRAFCRYASRRDFRDVLVRLQRPSLGRDVLARLLMAAWRERRGCRHGALCAWCRRSER